MAHPSLSLRLLLLKRAKGISPQCHLWASSVDVYLNGAQIGAEAAFSCECPAGCKTAELQRGNGEREVELGLRWCVFFFFPLDWRGGGVRS